MTYESPSQFVPVPLNGQRRDLAWEQVPDGSAYRMYNILNRDGRIVSRPGYTTQLGGSLTNRITGLTTYIHHTGNQKIVAATSAGWFSFNTSTQAWTDITDPAKTLATAIDDFQVFRIFYKGGTSYLVGCNGYSDAPKCWNGTANTYSDVGGSPGKPKAMCVLANRMLMANFTNAPVQVDVSDFNDFESGWGAVQVSNLADTPGEIMAMQEMGSLIACIYKTDAWYVATASATMYPFTFTLKQAGISGPMSAQCVVSTPVGHYILAEDGNVYKCDGSTYTPMGDHIRSEVLAYLDPSTQYLSFGFYDAYRKEVWFLYRAKGTGTTPNRGIVIRMDGTVWPVRFAASTLKPVMGLQTTLETYITIGSLTEPIGSYTTPLSTYTSRQTVRLLGTSDGNIFLESGNTDNGSGFDGAYQSGMRAISPERKLVTVGEIEGYIKPVAGGTAVVTVVFSDSNPSSNKGPSSAMLDLGVPGPYKTGCRVTSRFFSLYLWVYGPTGEIEYQGARISGVERGRR